MSSWRPARGGRRLSVEHNAAGRPQGKYTGHAHLGRAGNRSRDTSSSLSSIPLDGLRDSPTSGRRCTRSSPLVRNGGGACPNGLSSIGASDSPPGPFGNVKPAAGCRDAGRNGRVPGGRADQPAWQAYLLPTRDVGQPHAVEIELPADSARQQLAISIIEPDAAGRVHSFGRDRGVYSDGMTPTNAEGLGVGRHAWCLARTESPLVVAGQWANHSPSAMRNMEPYAGFNVCCLHLLNPWPQRVALPESAQPPSSWGLVLPRMWNLPRFADCLGTAEVLDAASGLSVDGWGTFLDAARRLAEETAG